MFRRLVYNECLKQGADIRSDHHLQVDRLKLKIKNSCPVHASVAERHLEKNKSS
ncbi:hypothetical protein DPMN_148371 [Dreissena polymorpha]|uniref:Uncharacterized protein n=1 Tax=Dreissena polymorpha TaxID=45954 RepID=A0A9D4FCD1_DREPO|nr:hypothetical protein DPMN_148371 [Dreissena polymorpha]